MGTTWSVVIADPIASHDQTALQAEIELLLVEVSRQMSTYDPTSEISQFNQSEDLNTWFPVSDLFAITMAKALGFSDISNGAFDPTVGPTVNLWGFGPDASVDALPSDSLIEKPRHKLAFLLFRFELPRWTGVLPS